MSIRRRRAITVLEILIVLGIIVILAAILFPIIARHGGGGRAICQSNEKQILLGLKQYIQDFDKYPPVGPNHTAYRMTNAGGWADSLQPYLKSTQIFQCPDEPTAYAASDPAQTDYGYNALVARHADKDVNNSSNTVMLFECNQIDATAATANLSHTANVCLDRRLDGSNYGFLDGHVKWLQSTKHPTTAPAKGNNFTFAS